MRTDPTTPDPSREPQGDGKAGRRLRLPSMGAGATLPRWWHVALAVAGVTLLLAALLAAATPQGRAGVRAALFVTEVLPAVPVKPARWGFGPDPVAEAVSFPIPEGTGAGDLYLPSGDGPHPAVLLFLGVAPAGADDPRVVNLGQAFARLGMAALFYWSPRMAAKEIDEADIDNLAAAFTYLRSRPEVDADRVGLGGFCVGASFALMAASRPLIANDVRYVNAFGPYHDLHGLAIAISSQSQLIDGVREKWETDKLTREVFSRQLARAHPGPLLRDPELENAEARDQAWLFGLIDAGMPIPAAPPWPLSPGGGAVHALLLGLPAGEAAEAVERLPPGLLAEMGATSPKTHLPGIKARVLLMHDRQDNLVPVQESRSIAAWSEALGPQVLAGSEAGPLDLTYTEFAFFQHVDPTRPVAPWRFVAESGKLFWHIYRVMRVAW